MTLDAEDRAWISAEIRRAVAASPAADAVVLHRLTIEQFACAVELSGDTIARRIRLSDIPEKFVTKSRPIKISPAALALFNVTPVEARCRCADLQNERISMGSLGSNFDPSLVRSRRSAPRCDPGYHASRNRGACKRDTRNPCRVCGWAEHMAIHDAGNRHLVGCHEYQL